MNTIQVIIEHFGWVINALFTVFLIYIIVKIFHIHPHVIFRLMIEEFKELSKLNMSVSSLNAACLTSVMVFGVIIIVVNETQHGLEFLSHFFEKEKIEALKESISLATMFYVVVGLAALSIAATLLEGSDKNRRD